MRFLQIALLSALFASSAWSQSVYAVTINFNLDNGGFTASSQSGSATNPWTYSPTIGVSGSGGWKNDGSATSSIKLLTSPVFTVAVTGPVTFSFDQRFKFEYDLVPTDPNGDAYDGGQLQAKISAGAFSLVPASAFTANGYVHDKDGVDGLGNGQPGWTYTSAGYASSQFIKTAGSLGNLTAGTTFQLRFRGGWDSGTHIGNPDWAIDNLIVTNVVPEPNSLILISIAAIGFVGILLKRNCRLAYGSSADLTRETD